MSNFLYQLFLAICIVSLFADLCDKLLNISKFDMNLPSDFINKISLVMFHSNKTKTKSYILPSSKISFPFANITRRVIKTEIVSASSNVVLYFPLSGYKLQNF